MAKLKTFGLMRGSLYRQDGAALCDELQLEFFFADGQFWWYRDRFLAYRVLPGTPAKIDSTILRMGYVRRRMWLNDNPGMSRVVLDTDSMYKLMTDLECNLYTRSALDMERFYAVHSLLQGVLSTTPSLPGLLVAYNRTYVFEYSYVQGDAGHVITTDWPETATKELVVEDKKIERKPALATRKPALATRKPALERHRVVSTALQVAAEERKKAQQQGSVWGGVCSALSAAQAVVPELAAAAPYPLED